MRRFFKEKIKEFLTRSIIPQKKILLVGGVDTDILCALNPSYGVHVCDPRTTIEDTRRRYPSVSLACGGFTQVKREVFDYVVFDDYLHYEDNLHELFLHLKHFIDGETKIFIICVNPLTIFALKIAATLGIATPEVNRNILRLGDLENLAGIFGYEILDQGFRFVCPFNLFGIGTLLNILVPRLPILRQLCFGQFLVLRYPRPAAAQPRLSCSIVIPCFNEEGNIAECLARIPEWGVEKEIIVVDDGSTDRTKEIVEKISETQRHIQLLSYTPNKGKGYAVNEGWKLCRNQVLMMLDCDMTTPPEDLPIFHHAMECGAEFINGTRIVYPREKYSLGFLNRLGVTFFAILISWITQRRITDTFCGTKTFLRKHRSLFNIEEFLWGDWDLFFAAARYRMKMVEVPVHYMARKAGAAKMRPFRHGTKLLWASLKGFKLIP
ncbi:MAG: glycosyltransferase family 2 protein [Candidatus Aureabacteria bacterium]|nr:glycosyltransferase family 2 protein [Candidatus Auribacterota bacterium]